MAKTLTLPANFNREGSSRSISGMIDRADVRTLSIAEEVTMDMYAQNITETAKTKHTKVEQGRSILDKVIKNSKKSSYNKIDGNEENLISNILLTGESSASAANISENSILELDIAKTQENILESKSNYSKDSNSPKKMLRPHFNDENIIMTEKSIPKISTNISQNIKEIQNIENINIISSNNKAINENFPEDFAVVLDADDGDINNSKLYKSSKKSLSEVPLTHSQEFQHSSQDKEKILAHKNWNNDKNSEVLSNKKSVFPETVIVGVSDKDRRDHTKVEAYSLSDTSRYGLNQISRNDQDLESKYLERNEYNEINLDFEKKKLDPRRKNSIDAFNQRKQTFERTEVENEIQQLKTFPKIIVDERGEDFKSTFLKIKSKMDDDPTSGSDIDRNNNRIRKVGSLSPRSDTDNGSNYNVSVPNKRSSCIIDEALVVTNDLDENILNSYGNINSDYQKDNFNRDRYLGNDLKNNDDERIDYQSQIEKKKNTIGKTRKNDQNNFDYYEEIKMNNTKKYSKDLYYQNESPQHGYNLEKNDNFVKNNQNISDAKDSRYVSPIQKRPHLKNFVDTKNYEEQYEHNFELLKPESIKNKNADLENYKLLNKKNLDQINVLSSKDVYLDMEQNSHPPIISSKDMIKRQKNIESIQSYIDLDKKPIFYNQSKSDYLIPDKNTIAFQSNFQTKNDSYIFQDRNHNKQYYEQDFTGPSNKREQINIRRKIDRKSLTSAEISDPEWEQKMIELNNFHSSDEGKYENDQNPLHFNTVQQNNKTKYRSNNEYNINGNHEVIEVYETLKDAHIEIPDRSHIKNKANFNNVIASRSGGVIGKSLEHDITNEINIDLTTSKKPIESNNKVVEQPTDQHKKLAYRPKQDSSSFSSEFDLPKPIYTHKQKYDRPMRRPDNRTDILEEQNDADDSSEESVDSIDSFIDQYSNTIIKKPIKSQAQDYSDVNSSMSEMAIRYQSSTNNSGTITPISDIIRTTIVEETFPIYEEYYDEAEPPARILEDYEERTITSISPINGKISLYNQNGHSESANKINYDYNTKLTSSNREDIVYEKEYSGILTVQNKPPQMLPQFRPQIRNNIVEAVAIHNPKLKPVTYSPSNSQSSKNVVITPINCAKSKSYNQNDVYMQQQQFILQQQEINKRIQQNQLNQRSAIKSIEMEAINDDLLNADPELRDAQKQGNKYRITMNLSNIFKQRSPTSMSSYKESDSINSNGTPMIFNDLRVPKSASLTRNLNGHMSSLEMNDSTTYGSRNLKKKLNSEILETPRIYVTGTPSTVPIAQKIPPQTRSYNPPKIATIETNHYNHLNAHELFSEPVDFDLEVLGNEVQPEYRHMNKEYVVESVQRSTAPRRNERISETHVTSGRDVFSPVETPITPRREARTFEEDVNLSQKIKSQTQRGPQIRQEFREIQENLRNGHQDEVQLDRERIREQQKIELSKGLREIGEKYTSISDNIEFDDKLSGKPMQQRAMQWNGKAVEMYQHSVNNSRSEFAVANPRVKPDMDNNFGREIRVENKSGRVMEQHQQMVTQRSKSQLNSFSETSNLISQINPQQMMIGAPSSSVRQMIKSERLEDKVLVEPLTDEQRKRIDRNGKQYAFPSDSDKVSEQIEMDINEGQVTLVSKVHSERMVPISGGKGHYKLSANVLTRTIQVDMNVTPLRRQIYDAILDQSLSREANGKRLSGEKILLSKEETYQLYQKFMALAELSLH